MLPHTLLFDTTHGQPCRTGTRSGEAAQQQSSQQGGHLHEQGLAKAVRQLQLFCYRAASSEELRLGG